MSILELPSSAEVLGAMITPAVLISASGTLSLATANRLGRVVDRVRILSGVAETLTVETAPPHAEEKRNLIASLLVVLSRRMRLLQSAVTFLYVAIGIFVATSMTLGLTLTAKWDNGMLPTTIGLCGTLSMFVAVSLLVVETRLAVQSTLVEVEFTRRLFERATQAADASRAPPPMA